MTGYGEELTISIEHGSLREIEDKQKFKQAIKSHINVLQRCIPDLFEGLDKDKAYKIRDEAHNIHTLAKGIEIKANILGYIIDRVESKADKEE